MRKIRNHAVGAAITATTLATVVLTGCDTGPECIDFHVEVRPVVKTVYINNKPQTTVTTETVTICDRYAEPTGKADH